MAIQIKGVTLFVYMSGKRKPLVKFTTTQKVIEFMQLLEQTDVPGKENIDKLVYTDTLFVGVYNKGNFDYDEPNEYFSIDKNMLNKLGKLPDNGLNYLESQIIAPNMYTEDYSDIYQEVINQLADYVDEGSVSSKTIAGAIKRALASFGIVYDVASDMVGELKRDVTTYLKNAIPTQYKAQSVLYESQQDFQALQQAAQDSYQQIVDDLDSEAVDTLEDCDCEE